MEAQSGEQYFCARAAELLPTLANKMSTVVDTMSTTVDISAEKLTCAEVTKG